MKHAQAHQLSQGGWHAISWGMDQYLFCEDIPQSPLILDNYLPPTKAGALPEMVYGCTEEKQVWITAWKSPSSELPYNYTIHCIGGKCISYSPSGRHKRFFWHEFAFMKYGGVIYHKKPVWYHSSRRESQLLRAMTNKYGKNFLSLNSSGRHLQM